MEISFELSSQYSVARKKDYVIEDIHLPFKLRLIQIRHVETCNSNSNQNKFPSKSQMLFKLSYVHTESP